MDTIGRSMLSINKQIRVPDTVLKKLGINKEEVEKGVIFIFKESKEGILLETT